MVDRQGEALRSMPVGQWLTISRINGTSYTLNSFYAKGRVERRLTGSFPMYEYMRPAKSEAA